VPITLTSTLHRSASIPPSGNPVHEKHNDWTDIAAEVRKALSTCLLLADARSGIVFLLNDDGAYLHNFSNFLTAH